MILRYSEKPTEANDQPVALNVKIILLTSFPGAD